MLQKRTPPPCLEGFEHIRRYWDLKQGKFIAKILPGEYYVSNNTDEAIATTLGSCVSACIWDAVSGIGGMNHFMLPKTKASADQVKWGNELSDATRYGNFAMEHLINDIIKYGALRKRLVAKVFGGGELLGDVNAVGKTNASFVLEYLKSESIPLISQDLNGKFPRKILFVPATGKALVKRLKVDTMEEMVTYEKKFKNVITATLNSAEVELF